MPRKSVDRVEKYAAIARRVTASVEAKKLVLLAYRDEPGDVRDAHD